MSSRLELLPEELILYIAAYLSPDPDGLAKLLSCSSWLHRRLQHVLYTPAENLERAIAWAIQLGVLETLKLGLRYGGSDVVAKGSPLSNKIGAATDFMIKSLKRRGRSIPRKSFLTLAVQTREPHVENDMSARIFRLLIESFPTTTVNNSLFFSSDEVNSFMHGVGKRPHLLRVYLETGFYLVVQRMAPAPPQDDSGGFPLPLLTALSIPQVDPGLIQMLLDRGACPNSMGFVPHAHRMVPLSVAIRMGSKPLIKLLVDNGAQISPCQGVVGDIPYAEGSRVVVHHSILPVEEIALQLASAVSLSGGGSDDEGNNPQLEEALDMLGYCVGLGANVNQILYPPQTWFFPFSFQGTTEVKREPFATPLGVFLYAVGEKPVKGNQEVDARCWEKVPLVLKQLFDVWGATAVTPDPNGQLHDTPWSVQDFPSREEGHEPQQFPIYIYPRQDQLRARSVVELLLDKWGVGKLEEDAGFLQTILMLVDRGALSESDFKQTVQKRTDVLKARHWMSR